MRKEDYQILSNFSRSLKFTVWDLEILLKSLEFYFVVLRQQYHDEYIDTKKYDDIYFDIYCLYHILMYSLAEVPNSYKSLEIPLYKRIDKREKIEDTLKRFKIA